MAIYRKNTVSLEQKKYSSPENFRPTQLLALLTSGMSVELAQITVKLAPVDKYIANYI